MRVAAPALTALLWLAPCAAVGQPITAAGEPAQLDIRVAGAHSIRVTLKPVGFTADFPFTPALAARSYPAPELSLRELTQPVTKRIGNLHVEVRTGPLRLLVRDARSGSHWTR